MMSKATRRIPRNGREAAPRRSTDFSNLRLAMKRFIPYGRGGITDLQVSEENDTQVEKVDVVTLGYGNNKWCHNNKG